MTHKYNLGDEVILNGVFDGIRFDNTLATIVALRDVEYDSEYKYIIRIHKTEGFSFHEGHFDDDEVSDYLRHEFEDVGHDTGIKRSNSGPDRFNIGDEIISGLNSSIYDPKQQPWDEEDI